MPGYEVVVLLDSDEDEDGVRREVFAKLDGTSSKLSNIELYDVNEIPDEE